MKTEILVKTSGMSKYKVIGDFKGDEEMSDDDESSSNSEGKVQVDEEKLLFCDAGQDELKIKVEALGPKDIAKERLSGDEFENGGNLSTKDCIKYKKGLGVMGEDIDQSEFDSTILLQDWIYDQISDENTPPMPQSKQSFFGSNITSTLVRSTSNSSRSTVNSNTKNVRTAVSESTTPKRETTKTPTQIPLSDCGKGNQACNSQSFTLSDSETLDRSLAVSGLQKSAQSLPLFKDLPKTCFDGRRSCIFSGTLKKRNLGKRLSDGFAHGRIKRHVHKKVGSREPYEFITTGTPLLKYRRWKDPHWRHFEVDTSLENFIWYSYGKSIKKSRIALSDIDAVLQGQVSPEFRKRPRKELEHQSFSIRYKGGKYLDLICINQEDFQMWFSSLKQLIENIQMGNKHAPFDPIKIRQTQEKSKEAIYPKKDGVTWHKYVGNLRRSQTQVKELLKMSEKLLKFLSVLPMRNRLKRLLKKLKKWADAVETSDWLMLTQYDELRMIRVEIRVLQIKVDVLRDLLAQEQNNKQRSIISNFLVGSSEEISMSLQFADKSGSIQSVPTKSYGSSRAVFRKPHKRGISDHRLMQAIPPEEQKNRRDGSRWRNSRSEMPVSPVWYRSLSKLKKMDIRKIMVDDIVSKSLAAKTVNRVCSTYKVSEAEVTALARYLDEKYSTEEYRAKYLNKTYKIKEVTKVQY